MAVNEQRLEKDQGLARGGHDDGNGKKAVNLPLIGFCVIFSTCALIIFAPTDGSFAQNGISPHKKDARKHC